MAASKTLNMVKRIELHNRMCSSCGGTGQNSKGGKCHECTNGVAVHQHYTEIELLEALTELGLIKWPKKEENGTEPNA